MSSATAEQLRQRNRLEQLADEIGEARAQRQHAGAESAHRRAEREGAAAAERAGAGRSRAAEDRLARARLVEAELSCRSMASEAKLAAAVEAIEKIAADLAELAEQIAEADGVLALLPDSVASRAALEKARAEAGEARRHDAEARAGRIACCARLRPAGAAWRKSPAKRNPGASGTMMPGRSRPFWQNGKKRRRPKSRRWQSVPCR